MLTITFVKLSACLSTMKGYPGWSEAVEDAYFLGLNDLADALGERMAREVLRAFDERPSVKALREWAVGLVAPPPFRLDAPKTPDAPRLTGPALERLGGACPDHVKAQIARFRQSHEKKSAPVPEADAGEWGVVMRYGDGRPDQRCPARYSEAVARAKADANNAKYPHVRCSVWRRGETHPQPAGAQREAVTA